MYWFKYLPLEKAFLKSWKTAAGTLRYLYTDPET